MKLGQPTPGALAALTSWLIALAAAWLAVANQPAWQTLLIAGVGCLYVFFPPTGGFSRPLLILMGLLLLWSLTSFLPGTWGGAFFRDPLQAQGFVLPPTLTPQPWMTLESFTLLLTTLLWIRICLEGTFSVQQREFLLTSFIFALGVVAVVKNLEGSAFDAKIPHFLHRLGQFANSNQSCDLLLMGGILAFARALADLGARKWMGVVWIPLTLAFMLAIIHYGSRATLLLFLLGLFLVAVLMPEKRRQGSIFGAVLFAIILLGVFLMAWQGTSIAQKFYSWLQGGDGRFSIYQDAVGMIAHGPWFGVGLGNFEGIFNTMRDHSLGSQTRNLHPESDWLWAAAEIGIPGVILLAVLLAVVYRTYFQRNFSPVLTKPCLVVGLTFLIHSFFDVGGHRMGTMWACIYLVSLGTFCPISPTDIKIPPVFLRAVGGLLLALVCLRIQSMEIQPWMPTRASIMEVESTLEHPKPAVDRKTLLDRAITWAPLDWRLYYQRGLACQQIPGLVDESTSDFNRALFLDQSSSQLPQAIAEACGDDNLQESVVAWKELLKRAGPGREEMMRGICYLFGGTEKARLQLIALAEDDLNLQAIAVCSSKSAPEFAWHLQELREKDPSLAALSPRNLQALLDRWVEMGDPAQFIGEWPQNPQWHDAGWKAYARALAKTGRYRDAVNTALEKIPQPPLPGANTQLSVAEASKQFLVNPQDVYAGMILYSAQMAAGTKDQALATLTQISRLPKRPQLVQFALVRHLLDANQDQAAWLTLDQILHDH